MKKPDKNMLITTSIVTVVVIVFNVIPPQFTSLALWPMFMASIFFFLTAHGSIKKIPYVIVSGATGMILTGLLFEGITALAPALGALGAEWLCLSIALAIIIVGGNYLPFALNNITFGYLLITASELIAGMHIRQLELALSMPGAEEFNLLSELALLIATLVVGGGLMCLACGGTAQFILKALAKKNSSATPAGQ